MDLVLRKATPGDLQLLRHWDEQPHVIASDPDSDWEFSSCRTRKSGASIFIRSYYMAMIFNWFNMV